MKLFACLFSFILLAWVSLISSASASSKKCKLNGQFQKIVYDIFGKGWAETQTSYGMAVLDATNGDVLCEEYVQPNKNIYPASTIKTLIALATLKQIEEGYFGLKTKVKIDQVNAAQECKHWNCDLYGPGKFQTVETLLWDMITVSNNIATNQLIDLVDRKNINWMAFKLGAPGLQVVRKVYDDVNPEPEIKERSRATAFSLVQLYKEIATGRKRFLSEDHRLFLNHLLANQRYHSSLNSKFPASILFYHKTGNTSQVTGDGGFYYLDDKRIVVLVGLQDFNRYRVCNDGCFWRNGFWSLGQIGYRAFDLSRTLY